MASVLLIDDDLPMRAVMRRALERAGHTVTEAGDGMSGIQRISDGGIDLVITDIIMPELDGIELIFNLRRTHPNLRVIAISGGGQLPPDGYLKIAQRGGAKRILSKPFELRELLEAVDEALK